MKIVGVLGGMGPLATMDLCNKIIKYTDAKKDSDHVHTLIDNNTEIPDRTAYILGKGENPEKYLIDSALKLEDMGVSFIVIPCNTAHYFYEKIQKSIKIPVVNMIDEVAKELKDVKKVGLLATKGTYSGHIYEDTFDKYGIKVEVPPMELQEIVMELIYRVKEGKDNIDEVDIDSVIEYFRKLGIDNIILGCTELPVAFEQLGIKGKFLDPTKILAISTIRLMGKRVVGV
ncbi:MULTISPECIES: aspartate/glutamate racemase family protein [Psychrilyobacter]|uniref:Amino acid racemase n=1 Tax=Psychrilyobacter piezotolerans TaxID=2293438 RepID=A0ABX9KFP1_9FUSO|nr:MULTISPECIES: amino acid racemase [Psychrilyobacter]MCS5420950.1 amino acid racemase [Psychrilyobacter sp. S5]NDI78300.1 aspartate/glutamate racemase family protein [Psychrilyobacter piezotolerans]RDE60850.1 aspartate/glutamate racemase family protein [Psychrilyobacter sp. S5]REI40639.1 amino acid racemase [Psychrilyobacter piezotolerans]